MSTIAKTSKKAAQLISNARAIKVYSLSNCFTGQPLTEKPVVWADTADGKRDLVEVSPSDFLRHELNSRSTKLHDNGNGTFSIDVHSNLWFEFESFAV